MSQIALLSGANPRSCKHGPVVRLLPGNWRIHVQGIVDSQLLLHVDGADARLLGASGMFHCVDVAQVQLHFGNRGNEEYITVTAERVA